MTRALPHLTAPKPARRTRIRTSALALAALVAAATTSVVVLGQVDSASALQVPGGSNTGVPHGTHLTIHYGDLTITKAGSVYDALDVRGFVYVKAANVTIKRSIIRGGVATTDVGLVNDTTSAGTNFKITDSELVPAHPSVRIDGIKGYNYTATRLNIHGTVDGAKVWGNNVTIHYSWIHNLTRYLHDPDQSNGPTHNDGVQVLGGHNILIQYNYIRQPAIMHSVLEVSQNQGSVSGLQFIDNWVDGAMCTVNMTYKPLSSMSGITVDSNRFGPQTPLACTIVAKPHVTFKAVNNIMTATNTPARVRILA